MEYIKGINLFNGLSSRANKKKETPLNSQKKFEEIKFNLPSEKSEPNTTRVRIEIQNSLPQKKSLSNISNIINDKNTSNIQDISTKEEDSSTATTISKLPKIQKHLTSSNLISFRDKDKESNIQGQYAASYYEVEEIHNKYFKNKIRSYNRRWST